VDRKVHKATEEQLAKEAYGSETNRAVAKTRRQMLVDEHEADGIKKQIENVKHVTYS
jgi:hypothetical protein